MRYITAFLLALSLSLFLPVAASHAAMSTRKTASVASVVHAPHYASPEQRRDHRSFFRRVIDNQHKGQPKAPSKSGWEGITSLVCSLCGFPILGIVFGALGMGKGHKHRNLAIAGFILGIAEIVLAFLVILLFFALMI